MAQVARVARAFSTKTGKRVFEDDNSEETRNTLKALGCMVVIEQKRIPDDAECCICLERIKQGTQLTLECGHVYHGKCCKTWANFNFNNKLVDMIQPTNNRKICYFRLNHNIFNCPQCRAEYTRDPFDDFNIKKVWGKVHSTFKGERFVHYLMNPLEITAYVPLSELGKNNEIGDKWAFYTSMLIKVLQTGSDKDLYPVKRLHPSPEFLLRSDYIMWRPETEGYGNGCEKKCGTEEAHTDHLYELVEIEDLSDVLNDKKR